MEKTPVPMRAAVRLAAREMRTGRGLLALVVLGMVLGVALMAGFASVHHTIRGVLNREAKALFAADISITHSYPLAEAEVAFLRTLGTVGLTIETRGLLQRGESQPLLAEARAVDETFPHYGTLALTPPMPVAGALACDAEVCGLAAEPDVLRRMGLSPGDRLQLGGAAVEIRAAIANEPGKVVGSFSLGPRVLVSVEALRRAGLLEPGALHRYRYLLKVPEGQAPEPAMNAIKSRFPDAPWSLRDYRDVNPRLKNVMEQVTAYASLMALLVLFLGGLAASQAALAYLRRKQRHIAIIRSLGAGRAVVMLAYGMQLLLVALMAGVLGALGAVAVAAWGVRAVEPLLGLALGGAEGITHALGLGLLFGLLATAAFTAIPLGRLLTVRPALLLRGGAPADGADGRPPRAARVLAAGFAAILVAVLMALLPEPLLLLKGLAGLVPAVALWWWLSRVLARRILPLLHRGPVWWRFAVAAVSRDASGQATVFALSLVFGLMIAAYMATATVRHALVHDLPSRAPTFFVIDIQPYELEAFTAMVAATPGLGDLETAPTVRGRIVALKGQPVDTAAVAENVRWMVRGDRGLTYADAMPASARVVKGDWWPAGYEGEPLVSLYDEGAEGLGVGIGDTMTLNVMGEDVTVRIANLRAINWNTLGINFGLMLSPNALARFPATHIATLHAADDAATDAFFRAVAAEFPTVSPIRIDGILNTILAMVEQIAAVVDALGWMLLGSGALVLIASFVLTHDRRRRSGALLQVIGARPGYLRRVMMAEAGLIVTLALLPAVPLGAAVGWMTRWRMGLGEAAWPIGGAALQAGGLAALVMAVAYVSYLRLRRVRPLELVR